MSDEDVGSIPMPSLLEASDHCERCKDSGVVARFTRTGGYKCAGPVPEDARGCYEDFCDCPEGLKALREMRL